ncbi:MAG: Rieske 2Fe-2S domain-containing protein [Actinomycetota bacterium]
MGSHSRRTRNHRGTPLPARQPAAPPRPAPDTFPAAVAESWRAQSWPARILRAFLGSTFVYAGIQKLADPGFLHSGSPTYIGTQLAGFARGSPIGGLLRVLGHAAVPFGIAIALVELAIGLATLAGVAPLTAAIAGAVVNLALLLSATWHVHPYFLGSDSIYAVAWIAYAGMIVERSAAPVPRRSGYDPTRRDVLRGGIVGAATVFLGGAAAAASRLRPRGTSDGLVRGTGASPLGGSRGPRGTGASPPPASPSPSRPQAVTKARLVAHLRDVPVGDAVGFAGPNGQPGVMVRLGQHDVVAFSRICTHAGCEVGYDAGARLLVCPCHGAEFDPSRRAMPVAGPAPTPLPAIPVRIDHANGTVVLPAH